MAVSEAQRKAIKKYDAEHFDVVRAKIKKEILKDFKEICEKNGESMSSIINKAILDYIEKNK